MNVSSGVTTITLTHREHIRKLPAHRSSPLSSRAVAAGLGTLSDGYVPAEVTLVEQVPGKVRAKIGLIVDLLTLKSTKTTDYMVYVIQNPLLIETGDQSQKSDYPGS